MMEAPASQRSVAVDLFDLLHPQDEADLASPGPRDPRFTALVAWARQQPRREITTALDAVLAHDDRAQQIVAMGVLRQLGIQCDGKGFGPNFRWITADTDGHVVEIEPTSERSEETDSEFADYDTAGRMIALVASGRSTSPEGKGLTTTSTEQLSGMERTLSAMFEKRRQLCEADIRTLRSVAGRLREVQIELSKRNSSEEGSIAASESTGPYSEYVGSYFINYLSENGRQIYSAAAFIELRHGPGYTLGDIASTLGISYDRAKSYHRTSGRSARRWKDETGTSAPVQLESISYEWVAREGAMRNLYRLSPGVSKVVETLKPMNL